MRSSGQTSATAELQGMNYEADADGNGTFDIIENLSLMARKMHGTDTGEKHIEAFKVLTMTKLIFVMKQTMGEYTVNVERHPTAWADRAARG